MQSRAVLTPGKGREEEPPRYGRWEWRVRPQRVPSAFPVPCSPGEATAIWHWSPTEKWRTSGSLLQGTTTGTCTVREWHDTNAKQAIVEHIPKKRQDTNAKQAIVEHVPKKGRTVMQNRPLLNTYRKKRQDTNVWQARVPSYTGRNSKTLMYNRPQTDRSLNFIICSLRSISLRNICPSPCSNVMMVICRIDTQPHSYIPTARLFGSRLLQELSHISLPELYFDNLSVCRYLRISVVGLSVWSL